MGGFLITRRVPSPKVIKDARVSICNKEGSGDNDNNI